MVETSQTLAPTSPATKATQHVWLSVRGTGRWAVSTVRCGACAHVNELPHDGVKGGWSHRGFEPCAGCGVRIPWPGAVRWHYKHCLQALDWAISWWGWSDSFSRQIPSYAALREGTQKLPQLAAELQREASGLDDPERRVAGARLAQALDRVARMGECILALPNDRAHFDMRIAELGRALYADIDSLCMAALAWEKARARTRAA